MERSTLIPFSSPRPAGCHIHPGSCNQSLFLSPSARGPTNTGKKFRRVPWLLQQSRKSVGVHTDFLHTINPTDSSPRRLSSSLMPTGLLMLSPAIPSQAQQTNISGNGLGAVPDPLVNHEVKIHGSTRPGMPTEPCSYVDSYNIGVNNVDHTSFSYDESQRANFHLHTIFIPKKQYLFINTLCLYVALYFLAQGLLYQKLSKPISNFPKETDRKHALDHYYRGNPHYPRRPLRARRDLVGEGLQENHGKLVFRKEKLTYSLPNYLGER